MRRDGVARATSMSAARPMQGGHGRARPPSRAAGQMRQRAQFAQERGRLKGRNWDGAARAVGGDRHLPLEDQHGEVARFALDHEDRAGFEGLTLGRVDQERNTGLGEIAERARRSNGGAQLREIFHVVIALSATRDCRSNRRRTRAPDGSCPPSGGSSCGARISASVRYRSRRSRNPRSGW